MINRTPFLAATVLAVALVGAAACGDDETTSTTSTNTTSTNTTSANGGAGGGGLDCTAVCTTLYQCGLDGTPQNCPGFTAADQSLFLNGDMMDGCVAGCEAMPIIAGLVDGSNCAQTVTTIKGANADFQCACDNGVGAAVCGSGGAGGGTGGSGTGGAGGN